MTEQVRRKGHTTLNITSFLLSKEYLSVFVKECSLLESGSEAGWYFWAVERIDWFLWRAIFNIITNYVQTKEFCYMEKFRTRLL